MSSAITPIVEMVKNAKEYEGDKYIYKRKDTKYTKGNTVAAKYALDEEGNLKEGYTREDTAGFATYKDIKRSLAAQEQSEKDKQVNKYVGEVETNPLDNFDLSTYNLKLYMIGPGSKQASGGNENQAEAGSGTQNSGDEARQDQPKKGTLVTSGSGYLNNAVRSTPEQTVVLAQTGVTEVGIDNLELITVPGGSGGKGEQKTLNFQITQPMAADFLDQIVKARTYLGAPPDAGDCPLFLEINFMGRTANASEEDIGGEPTITSGMISGKEMSMGPYIFPLEIVSINLEITESGTVYDFETVVVDDLYVADRFYRTREAMTITGSTIYEMLKDLEDQWNARAAKNKDKPTEQISFGLEDGDTVPGLAIADQTLDIIGTAENLSKVINKDFNEAEDTKEGKEEAQTKRENKVDVEKNPETGKITLDIKENITMDRILGILLSMNKEFMINASRSVDPTNPGEKIASATKEILWYRFEGTMEYLDYNAEAKAYGRKAYMLPETYKTPKTDIALFPWEVKTNNNLTPEETKTRVNQMNVKKAYEYIFTGRNDQILGVNLSYKEGIALLLPPERGMLGDISLNAKNILNSSPVPKNEKMAAEGLDDLKEAASGGNFFDKLKQLKNDLNKGAGMLEKFGQAAQSVLGAVGNGAFTDSDIKDLIQNTNGKSAQRLKTLLEDKTNAQKVADALTDKKNATNQANVVTQTDIFTPGSSGFIYGGDLIGENKYTEQLNEKGEKFKGQATAPASGGGSNATSTSNEDFVGPKRPEEQAVNQKSQERYSTGFANVGTVSGIKNNLFTYLYDQHQAVDFLMKLDLTVRGDPYWLGREPQPAGDNLRPVGQNSKTSDSTVNESTDNFFLFSLNSPRLFDPNTEDEDYNTGLWIKEGDGTSYMLSGIYRVKQVLHKFTNGRYEIDIESVKETAISLSNLARRDGNFEYSVSQGELRKRAEDSGAGSYTSSDGFKIGNQDHEFVKGKMAQSQNKGKSAEDLLGEGQISQAEYDAYKAYEKEEKRKKDEAERRKKDRQKDRQGGTTG